MHHDVVGAIALEIFGIANIAVAVRGPRFTFGSGVLMALGAGLVAPSHIV